MSNVYYLPKLGSESADVKQVVGFLKELGHTVEVPSTAEELFGMSWVAPMIESEGFALQGWQQRAMNWADTVVVVTPASPSAFMVAGHFIAQGKRAILLHDKYQPTNADLMYTELVSNLGDLLDVIGGALEQ